MINSRTRLLQKSQIYLAKKSKSPDHLFNLMHKVRDQIENQHNGISQQQRDIFKQKILQKRIDAILKTASTQPKVSEPVPFAKKKWISPLEHINENSRFEHFKNKSDLKTRIIKEEEAQVQRVVKILDINKKLKYFGQYLQVEMEGVQPVQVARLTKSQSRVTFLSRKFQQLQKQLKPRLCITNFPNQQKYAFLNYLEPDEFYQNIIRNKDQELMHMLITALANNGTFTLTSYMSFYSIFVWQSAGRHEQVQFVTKLLMEECRERPIVDIARNIDFICNKIHIENFNKSLQNFNEVMKKLLFGDDYEYSHRKQYYLTRKALVQSLQMNQECISIFINIFYAS